MTTGGVLTLGETMAQFDATETGSFERVPLARIRIGGAESNVAAGLSRLGVPVTWIGRVGDDAVGRRIIRELRGEGITVLAAVDAFAPTGLMLKEHPVPGSSRVAYYRSRSAGSALTSADIDEAQFSDARLLHLTGITPLLSDSCRTAVDVALDRASRAGIAISFDVNHRAALAKGRDAGAEYRRIASRADVVFAGVEEARVLTGSDDAPDLLADRIAALGAKEVVIKLGADGAIVYAQGRITRAAAIDITPVDTVGAGDAFVAGYLAELLAEASIDSRLATANAAGAFACLSEGDWEGYARRADLKLLTAADPVAR